MTRLRTAPLAIELGILLLLALACTVWAQPPSAFAFVENSLLRWMLFSIPLLLITGRRELPPISRNERLALAGIGLIAAGVRFGLRPLPYHPFNWMNDLVGKVASEPEPSWYANGFGIFMWLFTLPGLSPERALFAGNQLAGAFTPLALFLAVRSLGATSTHGLWAALLLAVTPLHARLSASESMQLIPTLLVVLSVVGFRGHAKTASRPLLFAGVLSFSYACLTRPETAVLSLALPWLYGPDRARLRDPWLWGSVAVAAMVGGPLVYAGALPHGVAPVSPATAMKTFAESLEYAGTPHQVLAAAGGIGLVALLLLRQWWMAGFLGVTLAAQIQLAGFENHPDNRLQLLLPELPWMLAAAATLPSFVVQSVPAERPRLQAGMASVLVAGLIVLVARSPTWMARGTMQREWIFLDDAVTALEKAGLSQIVRPQRPDFGPDYIGSLPDYRLLPGMKAWTVTDALSGTVPLPFAYYRSPDCGAGSVCEALEERYRLRPLQKAELEGHEIGLFVAEGLR